MERQYGSGTENHAGRSGQDFTEWYVRDGIVIDCQPFQGAVWVGARVTNQSELKAGSIMQVIPQALDSETPLNYPVAAIETLSADEASRVEVFGRKWAAMKGIEASVLGL